VRGSGAPLPAILSAALNPGANNDEVSVRTGSSPRPRRASPSWPPGSSGTWTTLLPALSTRSSFLGSSEKAEVPSRSA